VASTCLYSMRKVHSVIVSLVRWTDREPLLLTGSVVPSRSPTAPVLLRLLVVGILCRMKCAECPEDKAVLASDSGRLRSKPATFTCTHEGCTAAALCEKHACLHLQVNDRHCVEVCA
jgi:hypothetical protein